MKVWYIIPLLVLFGCDTSTQMCHLLGVAYQEQDELLEGWYPEAAKRLAVECHIQVLDDPARRGRDPDGFYNAQKEDG